MTILQSALSSGGCDMLACCLCMYYMGAQQAYLFMCTCRPAQVLMQPPAMQNAQQPVHSFLGRKAQREGTAGSTNTIDGADGRSPADKACLSM